jgi:hypothetical protein
MFRYRIASIQLTDEKAPMTVTEFNKRYAKAREWAKTATPEQLSKWSKMYEHFQWASEVISMAREAATGRIK